MKRYLKKFANRLIIYQLVLTYFCGKFLFNISFIFTAYFFAIEYNSSNAK